MRLHDNWERTRILATIVVQPHLRKKMKPEQILPLIWDKKQTETARNPEEDKKRFIELVKRLDNGK